MLSRRSGPAEGNAGPSDESCGSAAGTRAAEPAPAREHGSDGDDGRWVRALPAPYAPVFTKIHAFCRGRV
jgi:hypothetical protein